jgi:hypothetical protein
MLAAVVLLILGAHSSAVAGFAISKALPVPTKQAELRWAGRRPGPAAFSFELPCVELKLK